MQSLHEFVCVLYILHIISRSLCILNGTNKHRNRSDYNRLATPLGGRTSGRAGERAGGRAGERAGGRAGGRTGGRAGERAGGRAGERAGGRAGGPRVCSSGV